MYRETSAYWNRKTKKLTKENVNWTKFCYINKQKQYTSVAKICENMTNIPHTSMNHGDFGRETTNGHLKNYIRMGLHKQTTREDVNTVEWRSIGWKHQLNPAETKSQVNVNIIAKIKNIWRIPRTYVVNTETDNWQDSWQQVQVWFIRNNCQ